MENINSNVVNSIIGYGTSFNGNLDITGLLKIDGDFSGSIKAQGKVLIGHLGRAKCSIFAKTVVIGGVVKGDIFAEERVVVLSTGMVIGNIRSPKLVLESGVLFTGELSILEKDELLQNGEVTSPKEAFSPFAAIK